MIVIDNFSIFQGNSANNLVYPHRNPVSEVKTYWGHIIDEEMIMSKELNDLTKVTK